MKIKNKFTVEKNDKPKPAKKMYNFIKCLKFNALKRSFEFIEGLRSNFEKCPFKNAFDLFADSVRPLNKINIYFLKTLLLLMKTMLLPMSTKKMTFDRKKVIIRKLFKVLMEIFVETVQMDEEMDRIMRKKIRELG